MSNRDRNILWLLVAICLLTAFACQAFSLLVYGEIGRQYNLSGVIFICTGMIISSNILRR